MSDMPDMACSKGGPESSKSCMTCHNRMLMSVNLQV